MEEAAGDEPVPLAFGDRGAVAGRSRRRPSCRRPIEPTAAAGDLDQEGGDVERDQDEGRRGAGEPAAPPPTPRTTLVRWRRTPGSASRPGSASCSRGRSAARRRSRRRRSRGRGGGNRSRPSGRAAYNRRRWRHPSPARLYATLVGAALVVAGIVGFFYSASFGIPGDVDDVFGLLAVNGWHNSLHILTGALGLLVAGYAARRTRSGWARLHRDRALGIHRRRGESILGFIPVNTGDNFLHLALGRRRRRWRRRRRAAAEPRAAKPDRSVRARRPPLALLAAAAAHLEQRPGRRWRRRRRRPRPPAAPSCAGRAARAARSRRAPRPSRRAPRRPPG